MFTASWMIDKVFIFILIFYYSSILYFYSSKKWLFSKKEKKETVQPQVPLRLPCYDFTPVTKLTFADEPCVEETYGLEENPTSLASAEQSRRLPVKLTSRVWRAVSTRPRYKFTAACWSAITSDSNFMFSSCREQSELRQPLGIRSALQPCFLL